MDINKLNKIIQDGAQTFQKTLDADGDGRIEASDLMPALKNLFTNEEGKLDVSTLLTKLNADGLSEKVRSWLSNGENEAIEGEQLTDAMGKDTVSSFASQLGLKLEQAVHGLQEAVPQIIDQASEGADTLIDIANDLMAGDTSSAREILGLDESGKPAVDLGDRSTMPTNTEMVEDGGGTQSDPGNPSGNA